VNRLLVGIGLVLIFFGVIVASASNTSKDRTPQYVIIAGGNVPWETHGGPYESGVNLLVYFGTPPETLPDLTFDVEIWPDSHYDNKTVFGIQYIPMLGRRIVNVSLSSNDGGLAVSNQIQEIGGIVNYAGNYWVNITTRWSGWDPPPKPELRLEVVEKEYPYRFILPVGAGLGAVGASSLILGATSVNRKSQIKKKK
jgi:hypothetical protein